eukprot:169211-Pelagomonas_calceolata.AAC.1
MLSPCKRKKAQNVAREHPSLPPIKQQRFANGTLACSRSEPQPGPLPLKHWGMLGQHQVCIKLTLKKERGGGASSLQPRHHLMHLNDTYAPCMILGRGERERRAAHRVHVSKSTLLTSESHHAQALASFAFAICALAFFATITQRLQHILSTVHEAVRNRSSKHQDQTGCAVRAATQAVMQGWSNTVDNTDGDGARMDKD